MTALPQPDDLTSLVLRTDFTDDAAWDALKEAVDAHDEYRSATYVSDPAYAGISPQALVETDAAADDDEKVMYVLLADALAMTNEEHPLLAVDLGSDPGRSFRLPARWFSDVSTNLSIANTSFFEFADATDKSGTYRGFDDG